MVDIPGILPKKFLLMEIDPNGIFRREMQKNREKKFPVIFPGFPGKKYIFPVSREKNRAGI